MILAAVSCSDLSDCCDGCSVLVIQLQFCISADNHGTVFVLSDQLTMVDMYIHYWRTYEQSWEADFWNKMTSFFLVWQTCLISWFFFCMHYHDLKHTLDSKGTVSSVIKFQMRTSGWRVCITIVGTKECITTSLKDWHLIVAGINDLYNQTFSCSMKKCFECSLLKCVSGCWQFCSVLLTGFLAQCCGQMTSPEEPKRFLSFSTPSSSESEFSKNFICNFKFQQNFFYISGAFTITCI